MLIAKQRKQNKEVRKIYLQLEIDQPNFIFS